MADIETLVRKGNDAFNQRDEATIRGLYADRVRFRAPGMAEVTGIEAALMFNTVWWRACSNAHGDLTEVAVNGDVALARGVFTGTQDGPLMTPMGEIPATGKSIEGPFTWVFRYDGDKVVEAEILFDRMTVAEQLGVAPVPATA